MPPRTDILKKRRAIPSLAIRKTKPSCVEDVRASPVDTPSAVQIKTVTLTFPPRIAQHREPSRPRTPSLCLRLTGRTAVRVRVRETTKPKVGATCDLWALSDTVQAEPQEALPVVPLNSKIIPAHTVTDAGFLAIIDRVYTTCSTQICDTA